MQINRFSSRARRAGIIRSSSVAALVATIVSTAALVAQAPFTTAAAALQTVAPAPPPTDACGTPPPLPLGETLQQPMFPGGYPVALPAVAPTSVRNDLPNPYAPGVAWGEPGRPWGSTASVSTAPDGTIWVIDRCGITTVRWGVV